MRHAASALLVALASASQPPGGWPGFNNYPPPPQDQQQDYGAPPQQWGGYQQYSEQPQYGAEAVEPASEATPDDDADEAVEADVVAVGPGAMDESGKLIPMEVAVGDSVLLPEYGATAVNIGEEEFHLLRASDILGKFEG